jgi:hypothetical protein
MKDEPVSYLARAIERIGSGSVHSGSGSHVAGIFGKAANPFEKTIRSYALNVIHSCGLNYETDIRPKIKGPAVGKLTLGGCIAAMKEALRVKPTSVVSNVPSGNTIDNFLRTLSGINDAWVRLKHGDEVNQSLLLKQMKAMLAVYRALERGAAKPLNK